ncbi:MAG: helix-hairpin-helix domain-containing protein [bacterium]|jgi:competence ComEA-like helix-hairpin-helix protein
MSFFVGPLVPANTSRQLDWKPGVASHKARSLSEAIGIPYVKKSPPSIPLDINKATQQELTHLPGIGPVLAERIVRYRGKRGGFTEISEIQEVSGIGEKRYERLKPWIQVRGKER